MMWTDKNGSFSQAKFWSSVAYGVMTWAMVQITLDKLMTGEIIFAYLAIVGGAEVAKKWLTMKHEAKS